MLYSSVSFGSKMRLKLTLLVEPPGPQDDGLPGPDIELAPLVGTREADYAAAGAVADQRGHLVLEQDADAHAASGGLQRPRKADAGRRGRSPFWGLRFAGLKCTQSIAARCASLGTELPVPCAPRLSIGWSMKMTASSATTRKLARSSLRKRG